MSFTVGNIVRFDFCEWPDDGASMDRDPDGEYVLYEDMVAIVAKYKSDAERYRKIVNKYSPFIVRDVRRHDVYAYYLSPDLPAAVDAWPEGDVVNRLNGPI